MDIQVMAVMVVDMVGILVVAIGVTEATAAMVIIQDIASPTLIIIITITLTPLTLVVAAMMKHKQHQHLLPLIQRQQQLHESCELE